MNVTAWRLSYRADPIAAALADRHYSRQTPGARQFVPPGRALVLLTDDDLAVWVTSWPRYAQHAWPGAWVNTLFRREGGDLASGLIRQAVAVTRWRWPDVPADGMVTFIDQRAIRRKRDPGRCYRRAGFRPVGITKDRSLLVLQLLPADMPEPIEPLPRSGALLPFP